MHHLSTPMLHFLDYFFTVFHSALVLFVVLGWLIPGCRIAHQVVLGMVLIAWLLIGWYLGTLGYCPLTHWHWEVKRALGESHLPPSFVAYMLQRYTPVDLPRTLVDVLTVAGLVFGLLMAFVKKSGTKRGKRRN